MRKIRNGVYCFCSRKIKQGENVNTEVNSRMFAERMSKKKVKRENFERNKEIPKEEICSHLLIESKSRNNDLPGIE